MPNKHFKKDPWFSTLWSRWCAGENALASLLVLLLAGCASYLPHLYPGQLSYPLALLNRYVPASFWNRTTTHRKDQYVCDPRMPLSTMTFFRRFMCLNMYWHRSTSAWNRGNVLEPEFKHVFDNSLCFSVRSWLRRTTWLLSMAQSTLKKGRSRHSRRVNSDNLNPNASVQNLACQCLPDFDCFQNMYRYSRAWGQHLL